MRRETDRFIGCDLTIRERGACDDMKVRTGIASDANLLRTALYRLAAHLDVNVDIALFSVRGVRDRKAARRSKVA